MKHIFSLLLVFLLVSCNDDDDSGSDSPSNNSPNGVAMDLQGVNEFMQHPDGLFISLFIDDGDNDTDDFQAYTFQFDDQGTVSAVGPNDQRVGTYLVFEDDNRIELLMTFVGADPFDELNDDWYYLETSGNTIRFEDDTDSDNYRLEFTKN